MIKLMIFHFLELGHWFPLLLKIHEFGLYRGMYIYSNEGDIKIAQVYYMTFQLLQVVQARDA